MSGEPGYSSSCALCHSEFDHPTAEDANTRQGTIGVEAMAERLRAYGYVVYKKRPRMRNNRVRLANGTVLEQTTMEGAT